MHWLDEIDVVRGMGATTPDKQYADGVTWAWIIKLTAVLRALQPSLPDNVLRYMMAQCMFETADFRSSLFQDFNNASGITPNDHGYTSGTIQLHGFNSTRYATYENLSQWGKDYLRVLSLSPGKPIAAKTADQFFEGLQKNGFFVPADKTKYFNGLQAKLKEYDRLAIAAKDPQSKILEVAANSDDKQIQPYAKKMIQKNDPKYVAPKNSFFADHPMLAGAAALLLGVVVIKVVTN